MIRGALIYDAVGFERNQWFIQQFLDKAHSFNLDLKFYIHQTNELTLESLLEDNVKFSIVRTISPTLSKLLEKNQIKVFNNSLVSEIANNKFKTYELCRFLDIPVMNTNVLKSYEQNFLFPKVVKTVDGHGGNQVFLVNSNDEVIDILNKYKNTQLIIQDVCSEVGKDMRIYLLDGKVLATVLRTAKSGFKSNYSLGGRVNLSTPNEQQLQIIAKLVEKLKPDFIGIDFIFNNGKWVLNEIEDVVGTRMIYNLTDIDVVSLYLEHVKSKL